MIYIILEDYNFVYGSHQSVVINASLTDSTLKNKNNSVTYHFLHVDNVEDEWRSRQVGTDDKRAYYMTKLSIYGDSLIRKVRVLMYYIWWSEVLDMELNLLAE